jgi:prepilin-type N-terminal cleavage/methylation domain-containing protein
LIALFRLVRGERDARGYTVVEMMVATALLSVVVAAAFGVVIVMQNQAVRTTDRFTAEGEGQTIADRITKDLRTAVAPSSTAAAFASADVNDVTFFANLSDPNGPIRLHAYVALQPGTNVYVFHEDSTTADAGGAPGNYSYTTVPAVSRLDGRYLDTTQPIFTYYDSNNNQLTTPITTTVGLRSITAVGVNLRIRVRPNAPVVVINTFIHVRNVDYNPNT